MEHKKNINIGDNLNLSDFFSVVNSEKKKQKEEFKSIVGDLNLDSIFEEVITSTKKSKIKKKKEEKTLEIFENYLHSDKEEQIGKVEDIQNNTIREQKKEPTLIEKSLGLLSEPSEVKQQNDPITPLDQNFVTLDQLNKHYNLFLSRIQQQLSSIGGGGETRLEFLDDVDRNSVKVDNKFLKYNSSTGKWIGSNAGGGGPVSYATTYVTTTSYTITQNDYYVGVNTTSPVTITLPTLVDSGTTYVVKDELGQASRGTNRYITILPSGSDLIDGQNRAILAYDFGSLTFVYRNGWRVV